MEKTLYESYLAKRGPQWAQNVVLRFVKNHYRYQCLKLQQHKGLKLTQMIFLGKIWHWYLGKKIFWRKCYFEIFRATSPWKKRFKVRIFKYNGEWKHGLFTTFLINSHQHTIAWYNCFICYLLFSKKIWGFWLKSWGLHFWLEPS